MTIDFQRRLDEARRGEASAIEFLLVPQLPALHAFIRLRCGTAMRRREGADDIAQSVCRQVLGGIAGFRGTTEAEFKRWLYSAALNKILEKRDHHGAQRRDVGREVELGFESRVGDDALLGCYGHFSTPSLAAIAREEIERIEDAFDRLPDAYREVLTLARVAQMPTDEIASRLGKSEVAVRKLLSRARARLAMLLD